MSADAMREQVRDQVREQVRALVRQHLGRDGGDGSAAQALMQRFEAAFARGDVDGIVGCFAPDIEWRLPTGQLLRGREAARAFLTARFADPAGPRFADSRLRYFGDTVVQNYRVSLPAAGEGARELDGCDVYRLRDGLIVSKDAYWKQIGGAPSAAAAPKSLVVPLRVAGADGAAQLGEVLRRLAASPALAQACASGALRFELSVQPGADAACCAPCADGAACEAAREPAPSTPLLRGVVTERDVKALPERCTAAGLAPRAVLTPLARDALRQRGIALQPAKEA